MYLDTHERDEMQRLVLSFHIRWFFYIMERIGAAQGLRLFLLTIFYLIGLATILWVLPEEKPSWLIWVLCGAFIGLGQLSLQWYRRTVKKRIDANPPEKWFQEIEQLDVDSEERQLLLQLFTAMRSGTKEEIVGFLAEALQSPKFSRLTFLRELDMYLR